MGLDDQSARFGERAVRPEQGEDCFERVLQRAQWPGVLGGEADSVDELLAEHLFPPEEDLALVGEVPEEGAVVHARPGGDVGGGRGVVPALPVQVEGS